MNSILTLPDIKEIIQPMLNVTTTLDVAGSSISKTISEWVEEYKRNVKESRNKPRDHIFFEFVIHLLARQSNERWWPKIEKWFQEIKLIDNVNEMSVTLEKLKERGYRFPPQGVRVILDTKNVFLNKYGGDWDRYFKLADDNFKEDFPNDHFLKIKYVKHKVRDLALRSFSAKYIAVDSHVVDVLRRTGLICFSYLFGLEMSTNREKEDVYLNLRKLCLRLSEEANLEPGELDRIFWHYGRSICTGGKPKCGQCVVNTICLHACMHMQKSPTKSLYI